MRKIGKDEEDISLIFKIKVLSSTKYKIKGVFILLYFPYININTTRFTGWLHSS